MKTSDRVKAANDLHAAVSAAVMAALAAGLTADEVKTVIETITALLEEA